jgi:hypothetical protein
MGLRDQNEHKCLSSVGNRFDLSHQENALLEPEFFSLINGTRCSKQIEFCKDFSCLIKETAFLKLKSIAKTFSDISMERVVQNRFSLYHQLNALLESEFFSLISGTRCSKQKE